MSLHFAWIQHLKGFGERISSATDPETNLRPDEVEADRVILCQSLIKCADISNPVSIAFDVKLSGR